MPVTLPYGTWPSPITAEAAASSSPRLDGARFVADDVWWGESVPAEGGRMTVRSRRHGVLLPAPWNVGSRVHEYGGGAWTASDDGRLFFVEKSDQTVWEHTPGGAPRRLTAPDVGVRFGGLSWQHGHLLAVRETHRDDRVAHDIVEIVADATVRSLAAGSDFVAHPALSPDGERLAWIAWHHPDMPWDRAQLRVGRIGPDGVTDPVTVAGGDSSPVQPVWVDPDALLYADDTTGRWNLWRVQISADLERRPVSPVDADTGGPVWVLGTRWFQPVEGGRVVAVRTNGGDELVVIDEATGTASPLPVDVSANVSIEDARGRHVLATGAGAAGPPAVWLIDVDDPSGTERIAGGEAAWAREWNPTPRAVTFEGPHGEVHAFDYPPTSPAATAPAGELPPYLVFVHGGPTSHTGPAASAKVTYFTSRGIGVLDVNYGGSTGYGRAYRERLRGQWGVVDVDDVAAAAAGLAAEGRADAARLAIEGGSAGGWTVLAALANTDVFGAGISRYGVGDARALASDTHDFESRYLDGLIGPLPEAEAVYLERSPLSHSERFRVPVLLLQGADDPVVPPSQAEAIRAALAERGIPHAFVLYEGEAHGFRRPETTIDVLRKELAFLGAVFGFAPDGVDPLALS
ncbi:prolyl oligopeptidase family serine peptidase [Microbacterium horticulturae]|uniref:Prolyl oligopeptidase family serine peptidase n=1 Tax=Microbacterium horticulturae TaxID=3028316 RepID=A0ABY8BX56_9MICO|nr:prolyl oligopeptidase family serine peptidase [Microbacterium sp. KACC 23027]WEG07702.1 prolyl oligopeptidase family serine peptidase [Microbacterium sp. KACC 23027]